MKTKLVSQSPALLFDEELWFGTSDSEAAEKAAANSMAATAGKVVGAKHFPESARKLAELAREQSTSIDEFVSVIEQDPGLSARLLRLVNSSGFSLRQRCKSVRHAVTLVGTEQLMRIATSAAVLDLFDSEGKYAVEVLQHSAAMGAFCRYLGAHLGLSADDLFTVGVLHDIGKLMMLDTFGERYQSLIEQAGGRADALHPLERAEYGFDHGVLAAHVLKAWDIPSPIPKMVAWHHEPARAYESSTAHAALVQTVRLADALVHAMAQGATRADVAELARHDATQYLDISEAQLDALWPELAQLYSRALEQGDADEPEAPTGASSRVKPRTTGSAPAAVPKQFPCVECSRPSFGLSCPVCKGDLCPEHPPGTAGWCPLCARDYAAFAKAARLPIDGWRGVGAALWLALAIAFIWSLSGSGLGRGLVVGAFASSLLGLAGVIAKRSYLRSSFVRSRPQRTRAAVLAR